jgi:hypothetical protein
MFNTSRLLLSALAFVAVSAATPAFAGPPLICHPFETKGGALLPWGSTSADTRWNAPLGSYKVANLTADVIKLLDADAPVITRMENMRRATIYASKDPAIARELLDAVMSRAQPTRTGGAQALFDAGYLIESYRQAESIRDNRGPEWAAVDATIKTGGYAFVQKAIAMTGAPNAEMEFAASLMTQGAAASEHRARAAAAAVKGSALAANLAKY